MDIEATKKTIAVVDKVTFTLTLEEARELYEDICPEKQFMTDQRTKVTKSIAEKLRPFC